MPTNIKQHLLIVLLLLGGVTTLVYLSARDHLEDFDEYHQALADSATRHASDVVELYLSNLHHSVDLFARQHISAIRALLDAADKQQLRDELEQSLSYFLSGAGALTVADAAGRPLLPDSALIGRACLQNLRLFALDKSRASARLRMHRDAQGNHFDVLTEVNLPDGTPRIMLVTVRPDVLASYIASAQPEHHRLYLMLDDGSHTIELSAQPGQGPAEGHGVMSARERQRVLRQQHIENTRWHVVDVLEAGVRGSEARHVMLEGVVVLVLLMVAGVVTSYKIVMTEKKRHLASEQLRKNERELERTVQQRTQALKKANARLEQLSLSDGLTGIANRRHFDAVLNREIGRANRENKPLSLLLFDIDFFKNYNDSMGHLAGDDCLRKIARAVDAEFKRGGDLTARYGGEEFAIILPGSNSAEASKQAERVREIVHGLNIPHPDSSVSERVTVSVGGSTLRGDQYKSANELIDEADEALYQAKSGGRNHYRIYAS